jgi:hypothetical protein
MADLRTRIATVLCALYSPRCCDECDQHRSQFEIEPYLADADAVIAELGLRRESTRQIGPTAAHRYITDWKADDE